MIVDKRFSVKCFGLFCLFLLPFFVFTQSRKPKSKPFSSVKIGVAPIFVGEVLGQYEKSFNKKSTFEIGVGLLTDNYIKNALEEAIPVNARRVVPGPAASFAYHYYPFNLGEQLYFSVEYKYRLYRKNFSQDGGNLLVKEYQQRMMPRIGIGYNFYMDEKFYIDFSGNLGFVLDKTFQIGDIEPIKTIKLNFGFGLKFCYRLSKAN